MENGKRKREDELPRITYVAGDRTFERLFKETSLEQTKEVVRRKLQLSSNSTVKLKQRRDGIFIDLDDDDDFDAFYARARTAMAVDVTVDITQTPPAAQELTTSAGTVDALSASKPSVVKKKRKATTDEPLEDANAIVAHKQKIKKRKTDQPASKMDAHERTQTPEVPTAPVPSSLKSSAKPKVLVATKATDPTDGQPPKKKPKPTRSDTSKDAASTQIVSKPPEKPPKKTKKATNAQEPAPLLPDDDAVPAHSGPSELLKKPTVTEKKASSESLSLQSNEGETSANRVVNRTTKKKASKNKGKETVAQADPSDPAPETPSPLSAPAPTKGGKKVVIAEVPALKEKKTKQSKPSKAKASNADAVRPADAPNIQDIVDSIARASAYLSKEQNKDEDDEDDDDDGGGVEDDSKRKSTPPSKQNTPDVLPSSVAPKSSERPDDLTSPPERKKGKSIFDTDDTRVCVLGAPGSDKDSTEDDGEAREAPDVDKPSKTSPSHSASLSHNKTETNDDPIEPADDLVDFRQVRTSDVDPIEVTTPQRLKATKPLSPGTDLTPKSGVIKRMKNRHGQYLTPSQYPVRADEPNANHQVVSQRAGAEMRTGKFSGPAGSDKASIREGKGATRADLIQTFSQPVRKSGASNGHVATPSHSQPSLGPVSLDKWATIQEPSPSVMNDELGRSSSPLDTSGGILGGFTGKTDDRNGVGEHSDDDSTAKNEPIFTLTASQVPFPYSQYNNRLVPNRAGVEEKKTSEAKTRRSMARYPRLSDIASQSTLFSQRTPTLPGPSSMPSRKGKQVEDDDDESSSSESEDESQSHIPKARRAGKLGSKKTKGLLASLKY